MIKITNQYNTAIVYSDVIDPGAEGLLRALCGSPLTQGSKIRIMPDVHAGKGCAVGTTMTLSEYAAPGLVGVDIGCGMTVLKVRGRKPELQHLDKLIRERVPAGRTVRSSGSLHRFAAQANLAKLDCARHIMESKALRSVGTLGGGNHFIELDKGQDGAFWLIIHSGSRHLGVEVAQHYQEAAFKQCPPGTPYEFAYASGGLLEAYLHDMRLTQEFAALNRQAIADEIVRGMKFDVLEQFDTIHNYIDTETRILRKGAVSAQQDELLLIPLNMRDGCLLCRGKGNPDWNFSAPHGAGRLFSRSEAKQSFTVSQFKKEMHGVYSTSICRATLDESPMAYKPMQDIIRQIEPTVEVLERLTPVYNFKAGEA